MNYGLGIQTLFIEQEINHIYCEYSVFVNPRGSMGAGTDSYLVVIFEINRFQKSPFFL